MIRKDYIFYPLDKKISFSGEIKIECFGVIINLDTGEQLYNPLNASRSGSVSERTLVLTFDTSGMDAGSPLQIFYSKANEIAQADEEHGLNPTYVTDTNLMEVLGSQSLNDGDSLRGVVRYQRSAPVTAMLAASTHEVRILCKGFNSVLIQIAGTWVGTISFQGSVNGADFVTMQANPVIGGVGVALTTLNGAWSVNCAGLAYVRCLFSAATSGMAMATMVADSAKTDNVAFPATQTTVDSNLAGSLSSTPLYRPSITEALQQVVAPIVNPTQPATYVDPKFANYAQRYRRLRVEAGGDQGIPFAQDPATNKLLVLMPETYSLLEQLLMQQTLTNQLLAQAFNLPLPSGMSAETT